jgi:hypothetical protein
MKIIIEVTNENGRTNTEMTVEECFTDLDKGMAAYFGQKFREAIDEMYDGAEKLREPCDTCETIMVGVCPECGKEHGRIL